MQKHKCLQICNTIIVLLALAFFLRSLYSFVFDIEYNKCDMTYMMQYPEYIPVTLPGPVQRKFPQYNLYVYTEGHSEPVRRGTYEGIPLLFIPGNDGSHKQVRSLASVAIQMRKSLRTKTRFDCFAVDLNSEFSAFHGSFLYRQSEFVQHVVDHIESLYPSRARFSIVLVGHSMGGLLARHAMTLDGFDKGRVPLIVTLATPHQRPVLNTDSQMHSFYAEMNDYWRSHKATSLGHVSLVSIGGGDRDIEVALGLTRLDGLALPRNSLWASASHVRDAWASTDHRCIVWCKQLVIALCRALFAASADGFGASTTAEFRRRLLPSAPPSSVPTPTPGPKVALADDSSRWFYRDLSDPRQRSFRFERERLTGPLFLKIMAAEAHAEGRRLLASGESAVFMLDGSGAGSSGGGWLFVCLDAEVTKTTKNVPCASMAGLDAAYGRDLPPSGLRRRFARVDADGGDIWRKATAFVVVLGPSEEQTELHFDLSPASARNLRLNWWSKPDIRLPAGSLYHAARMLPPAGQTIGLEATLEAHNCRAFVGSPGCLAQEAAFDGTSGSGYSHAVQYFNHNVSLPLSDCTGGGGDCLLHVITNPLCEHTLSVRFRPHQFGAALLRDAGTSLPTWVALQVLSTLLASVLVSRSGKHQSLYSCFTGSPLPLLASAVACCLPQATNQNGPGILGGLVRHLCLACLALPFSAGLLLCVAASTAWLGLLMRAPRSLLPGQFSVHFANFLSPLGCILALCLTQWHCAAAGIAFLLVSQLLKTAAARLSSSSSSTTNADGAGDADEATMTATKTRDTRLLAHHSALAVVCALLACLCAPSLFVWAKALQQQAETSGRGGVLGLSAPLPVADPHYGLGVAFALVYALDSALLASRRFYAPPLDLSWPIAVCASLLIGSVASMSHGNYALHCNLILFLFTTYTFARCAKLLPGMSTVDSQDGRPKRD